MGFAQSFFGGMLADARWPCTNRLIQSAS